MSPEALLNCSNTSPVIWCLEVKTLDVSIVIIGQLAQNKSHSHEYESCLSRQPSSSSSLQSVVSYLVMQQS